MSFNYSSKLERTLGRFQESKYTVDILKLKPLFGNIDRAKIN